MHQRQNLPKRTPDDLSALVMPCTAVKDHKKSAGILTVLCWVEFLASLTSDSQHNP